MRLTERIRRSVLDNQAVLAVARKFLPRADVRLYRATGGRFSLTPRGARVLLLTTTGRRSGQPRPTPLIYTTEGTDYLVVGSNWGASADPAWLLNLSANPDATIEVGRVRHSVTTTVLGTAERAEMWPLLVRSWPLYADLAASAGDRELPVVRLSPM